MATDELNDLLHVTMNPSNWLDEEDMYTEKVQRQLGLDLLGPPVLENTTMHGLLIHDLSYIFSKHLVERLTGILSWFGKDFVKESIFCPKDIAMIMQYLEQTVMPLVVEDGKIYNDTIVNPYRLWKFANAWIGFSAAEPDSSNSSRSITGRLCRTIVFKVAEFCQLENFASLKLELKKVLERCKEYDPKIHTQYFEEKFRSAFQEATKEEPMHIKPDLEKYLRDKLTRALKMDPKVVAKLEKTYEYEKSRVRFNSCIFEELHARNAPGSDAYKHLAGESSEIKDDIISSSNLTALHISGMIGRMKKDKIARGNAIVTIELAGHVKTTLLYATVAYCKKTYMTDFFGNTAEIIMPVYDDEKCQINVHLDIGDDKCTTVKIPSLRKPFSLKTEFGSLLSKQRMIVTSKFIDYSEPVPCLLPPIYKDWRVLFDYVCHTLVHEWISSGKVIPPRQLYLFAMDLCWRYCVSAGEFYATLISKFMDAFNESGTFIDSLTHVMLSFYAIANTRTQSEYSSQYTKITSAQMQIFENAKKVLMKKIPEILSRQMSVPEKIERKSISSLIMMLSMVNGEVEAEKYFAKIFKDSIEEIEKSVIGLLKYVPSDRPLRERNAQEFFNVNENMEEWKHDDTGFVLAAVDLESLQRAADAMVAKIGSITAFYTHEIIPGFANAKSTLTKDFANLALKFAKVWTGCEPPPPDMMTLRFVSTYRELWNLTGRGEDRTPAVLFNGVIVRWIQEVGDRMLGIVPRLIKVDKFETLSEREKTSCSCSEIFRPFNGFFTFIEKLGFQKHEIETEVMTYIALCMSSIKTYIDELLGLVRYQFRDIVDPKDLPFEVNLTLTRELTFKQIYVIINNIMKVGFLWKSFSNKFVRDYGIDMKKYSQIKSIKAHVQAVTKCLGIRIADHVRDIITNNTFTDKKILLTHKTELRKNVAELIEGIPDDICEYVGNIIDEMRNTLMIARHSMTAAEFLRYVELGFFEGMIPFTYISNTKIFNRLCELINDTINSLFGMFERIFEESEIAKIKQDYHSLATSELRDVITNFAPLSVNELKDAHDRLTDEHRFVVSMLICQKKNRNKTNQKTKFSFYHADVPN